MKLSARIKNNGRDAHEKFVCRGNFICKPQIGFCTF